MEKKLNASVEQVFALMTDARWLENRSLSLGELAAKVSVRKTAKGAKVSMQRRLRRDLPALVAKIMAEESDVHFEETWVREEDAWVGTWEMQIVGQPVRSRADFSLRPHGKGCVYAITHQTECSIAFVGGAVAKYAQGQIEAATVSEMDYLARACA